MMRKILIVATAALAAVGFAGLGGAHTAAETPTSCSGGQDYSKAYTRIEHANVQDRALYLVYHQGQESTITNAQREDKASPLSLWLETNTKVNLQTTEYRCTYADGHVYGRDAPMPDPVHTGYLPRPADRMLTPMP